MWLSGLNPSIILLLFMNIFSVLCEEKSSLSFVIDNTFSMSDDLSQVKRSTKKITNAVFDEKGSQIENMVLVTFNDPGTRVEIVTDNRNKFEKYINKVYTTGGGDCPEYSMKGILSALKRSLPGSFIYVFTDAAAKDYKRSREVTDLCQKKQSQIVFVLTGHCGNGRLHKNYLVYYDIATACSGLVLDVEKSDVNEVIDSVIIGTIIGKKSVIKSVKIPAGQYTHVPFEIDDQTEYAIVTASGTNVLLSVDGHLASKTDVTQLPNFKAIKLINPPPGTYTATVKGDTETSVYIVGRTDFTFKHGFSNLEPKTIKDTSPQPFANTDTHLSIFVTDPKHKITITSAELLDENERPLLLKLPLRRIAQNLYVTRPFKAPSVRFKIAVHGSVTSTGKNIMRKNNILITPPEPPETQIQSKAPVATISEGKSIQVEYGQTTKLTCRVSAYPEPIIEWFNTRKEKLISQSSLIEEPYNYISYLTITDVTKNDKYTCQAKNKFGKNVMSVDVIVKDPFTITSVPKDVTELLYGVKGTLRCDITAPGPMHISWYLEDKNTGANKQLMTSDKYTISDDGTTLTINRMGLDTVGKYTCKAVLNKHQNKVSVHETRVQVTGLISPTINISPSVYRSIEGINQELKIHCKAAGLPKPNITWKVDGKFISSNTKFLIEEGTLVIKEPKATDSGSYTCEAQNDADTVHAAFRVDIRQMPEVSGEKSVIATKGLPIILECGVVKGVPKPTISWQFKAKAASVFEPLPVYNDELRIPIVNVTHAGSYKCVAHNVVGDGEHITTLTVHVPPTIITSHSVFEAVETRDRVLRIPCKVTGFPKPTITWKAKNAVISPNAKFSIEEGTLVILEPKVADSGEYKCEAQNEARTVEATFRADIRQLPVVSADDNKIAVKGQSVNLECKAVKGVPIPKISWQFKSNSDSTYKSLSIYNDVLRISNVGAQHAGSYKCVAHNVVGDAEHITTLTVHVPPTIISSHLTYDAIETRDRVLRIPCKTTGLPKPRITWKVKGATISPNTKFAIEDGTLVIRDPKAEDSETYTCEAQNAVDTVHASFKVNINQLPEVFAGDENRAIKGQPINIVCKIRKGVPKPTISWHFKSNAATSFGALSVYSEVLRIPSVGVQHAGSYKCVARNVAGYGEHITTLTVLVPPSIVSSHTIYEAVESEDRVLKIPCKVTGNPEPIITWSVKGRTISSNTKFAIEDGTLVIREPKAEDSEIYTCEAQNELDTAYATFRANIYQLPQLSGVNEKIAIKGQHVEIQCSVLKGLPRPIISWQFKRNAASRFTPLSVSDNVLRIPSVGVQHAGSYKCVAHNVVGDGEHITKLTVHVPPHIISSPSVYEGIESRDRLLKIPCKVTGNPEPIITWKLKNAIITSNTKFSIEDGTLVIREPKVTDSGTYTCEAQNDANTDSATFRADIRQLPELSGEDEKVAIKGQPVNLECTAIKGVPEPIFSWQFKRNAASAFETLPVHVNVLRIPNVGVQHGGSYKCIAHNVVGDSEHITTLTVHVPPDIASSPSVYEGVERDRALTIPCQVTGIPKPIITWKVKGANISPNSKFSIENGNLIIKEPKVTDSDVYTCEAQNAIDTVRATFRADIHQLPVASGDREKIAIKGRPIDLQCKVLKGAPKPTISWQFKPDTSTSFEVLPENKDVLRISKVDVQHGGSYKCVAHNVVGDSEHITTLTVHVPPKIVSKPLVYEAVETRDRVLRIPCKASGRPQLTFTWKVNGTVITSNAKYSIEDGTLVIKEPKVTDSDTYTCEAENDAGSDRATFRADIHQMPEASGLNEKIAIKGQRVDLECKASKGVPKPTISWQFKAVAAKTFEPLRLYDDVLRIPNVGVQNAGSYKCVAHNVVGDGEHITVLTVQVPPSIVSNPSVYEGVEEKDRLLKIPCQATGFPEPIITWKVKGAVISANTKFAIEDGTLVIKDPTVADSDIYTCDAQNDAATAHATFRAIIRQLPEVTAEDTKIAIKGQPVSIECDIVKGVPEPTISWQFKPNAALTFELLSERSKVLHLINVGVQHAGSYKCVAHNIVGDDEHITTLNVHVPPVIATNTYVYEAVETRDRELKIPCNTTGIPKPIITWKAKGAIIFSNQKYLIKDGALVIKNPELTDTQIYTCEAHNGAGTTNATFQVNILQAPELTGLSVQTVRRGHFANIECKVAKGVPKPTITWHFEDKSTSMFEPIHKSGEVLNILTVGEAHAGRYKCIARNHLGHDEHITELVVEFIPAIISNSTTISGIEGDTALRIPCDTVGVPRPVITWKVDDKIIRPNEHYMIINGSLIIKDPMESDSNFYTCEAKNYIGTVYGTFRASVTTELEDFGVTHEVNVLDGTTFDLDCGPDYPSQSIKWYKDHLYTGVKGRYYHFKNISLALQGNYTCHVSDINGARTETSVVIVGYLPRFQNYQDDPLVEWFGNDLGDELDCEFDAKPDADVEWSFNGKVLSDQASPHLSVPGDWGHYTCNVSNVHGAIQRSFDVQSTVCLIGRKPKKVETMPLVLNPAGTWPVLDSTTNYLIVEADDTVIFSCPDFEDEINSLQNTLGTNEVTATCVKQDEFKVEGKSYRLSDFHCAQPVNSMVVNKHEKCLGDTSEVMRVGYEVHGFLETYEVCFDVSKNIPLYSRAVLSKSNRGNGHTYSWYTYPGLGSANVDTPFTCTHSKSSCCYTKAQLVNTRDVNDGPAQKSTFIDPLNAVPLWQPCDVLQGQSPWASIENMIRSRVDSYDQFVVWSGTHNLRNINGVAIPRFLWKVVRFAADDMVAMIYVNGPLSTDADILCSNICADNKIISWIQKHDDHIYCCEVNDFLEKFGLSHTSIGEHLENAMVQIQAQM